ncbi:WD40 repeat-containing protein [Tieghemostelium lacteum]|uniref:WD40 repeat-containing protein n=1 Tax=Tieghemostelium lacteum TaxID=361077 RepID=A0A151Z2Y3_TIELA|nr:WD40 repeat-containing protein [Tieghemostelium lacteum]|eukprot:KYQ88315.1 WD40 repeat-containing protein [Tieghemostelium lacteum]
MSYIKENDKIVLMCNYGFRDMTMNLLYTFNKIGVDSNRYFLFALDDKVYDFFQKKNIKSIRFKRELEHQQSNNNNDGVYGEDAESYGNVGFRAICNEKPLVVLDVLKKGYNVLWTDTDIVWLSDPLKHFYETVNRQHSFEDDSIDLYVQQDDDDICAGFYFIRSNPRTIQYMETVIKFLNPVVDDQIAMRKFLKEQAVSIDSQETLLNFYTALSLDESGQLENKIRYFKLNRQHFPNGTAYFNLKLPQRASTTPVIVHNNCIIGHRSKKERFVDYGLWYVSEEDCEGDFKREYYTDNAVVSGGLGSVIKVFKGHFDVVTSVHSLGDRLYTTSLDKSIKIWDAVQCKFIKSKFIHQRGAIWSQRFVRVKDQDMLLTASHDKTIQMWDIRDLLVKDCFPKMTFSGHTNLINQISSVYQERFILSASDDKTIRLWDLHDISFKRVYLGHSDWVSSVDHNQGNGLLFSSSRDGTVRVWEFNSGRCSLVIETGQGWVRKVVYNSVDQNLLSAGNDGSIKVWNIVTGQCQGKCQLNASINDMVILNNVVYIALENGRLLSLKLENIYHNDSTLPSVQFELGVEYEGHPKSSVNCLHVSEPLSLLFSGGFDKQVKSWNIHRSTTTTTTN